MKDAGGEGHLSSRLGLLEDRVRHMEQLGERQRTIIQDMDSVLRCVVKDIPHTVSVLQYNILASYLGENTKPWFLYGADVSSEQRVRIFERYYAKDDHGVPKYRWPEYAAHVLSRDEISSVLSHDDVFKWESRGPRLVSTIRDMDPDIASLVELDQHAFFADGLGDQWDSVFQKRPRKVSTDGCGIFWRRAKFSLQAFQGFEFVDKVDTFDDGKVLERRDRCCLIALLRWRATGSPLVVVSTHLARNPEDRAQTIIRVRQVTQLVEWLTDFTEEHHVPDAPVIMLGDLNSQHFGEIRGIAHTVWTIKGDPMHQFLWNASDVATGPTSITTARQVRIDIVQYPSRQLELLDVEPVPKLPLGAVIPNEQHPSDHLPVFVTFKVKSSYRRHQEFARAWLECIIGHKKVNPLAERELRAAFEFFDREQTGKIDRFGLEEACNELQTDIQGDIQQELLKCFPESRIIYQHFQQAYEARLNHDRMRSVANLEQAFLFIAEDCGGGKMVHVEKLAAAFHSITPFTFSKDDVGELIQRVRKTSGGDTELVDLRKFCEVVCTATFAHRTRWERGASPDTPVCEVRIADTPEAPLRARGPSKEITLRLEALSRTQENIRTSDSYARKTDTEVLPIREVRSAWDA